MFRLKRGPRTTQPQMAARVDWSNPIARGLILALNPAQGNHNIVSGKQLAVSGSGISASGVSQNGRVFKGTSSSSDRWDFTPDATLTAGTILAVCSHASANPGGSLWHTNSTENDFAPFASDSKFYFSTWASSRYISAADLPAGSSFDRYVVCARGSGVASTHAAFVDGKLIGSTNSAFAAVSPIRIGANGFNGGINTALYLLWGRALSDTEVAEISRRPWQLFAPSERRIWAPSAGGGAATATLDATGATGTFSGAAQTISAVTLATTGGTGTFAGPASSPAVAALAGTGGTGTFAGAASSATTVSATIAGGTGAFAGAASSTTTAVLAATGISGAFAGSAGSGTSASLAVAGGTGTFAATASAPASVALAALGGEGAFAGSAYPLTTAQVAALGQSGAFSGVASTVGTASLAATGDSGGFAGSAVSIGSAFLASLGESGTFAGSASVAAPSTVGRPASDISNSGWAASTGSDLYAMLDEATPAPSDYIVATTAGAVCEVALNPTNYPGTAAQILKFRASSSTGNSVIVRLRNVGGATVRSATQALTPTDTEYSLTLTAGEIAAITSGALSVQLESA